MSLNALHGRVEHAGTQKRYLPTESPPRSPAALLAILAALVFALAGCAGSGPKVSQTKRALDPAGFPQAVNGPGFSASAVAYEPGDDGFDYRGAGFTPVLLVLKSSGAEQPQIIVEDVRVVTPRGEFLPYTPAEAARLAVKDLAFSEATKTAFKDGFVGAVIGGGLGALAGLVLGKDPSAVWKGAAVGAAAGGAYGAISSRPQTRSDLARTVSADLEAQAWREDPLAPGTTRAGYVYLPSGLGATSLRLLVRGARDADVWVSLPIVSPRHYAQPAMTTARRPAEAGDTPRPKPAPAPAAERAPGWTPRAQTAAPDGADMAQSEEKSAGQTVPATAVDQTDDPSLAEEDEAPAQTAPKAPQRVSRQAGRSVPNGAATPNQRTPRRPAPVTPAPEGVRI